MSQPFYFFPPKKPKIINNPMITANPMLLPRSALTPVEPSEDRDFDDSIFEYNNL